MRPFLVGLGLSASPGRDGRLEDARIVGGIEANMEDDLEERATGKIV